MTLSGDRIARLQLPESLTAEHLNVAQKDLELLAEIMRQYPDEFLALQNAVLEHDFRSARQLGEKIGLNEEAFVAREGGVWVLVAVIAIGAALLLSSDSPPPPPPPPANAGAPDAGTG
jgi:hypothetical protein